MNKKRPVFRLLFVVLGLVVVQQCISTSVNPINRIWTPSDLDAGFSVLNLDQMQPFFERLEAGHPITVLAFGDSIIKVIIP
jgi:hypothetical protein